MVMGALERLNPPRVLGDLTLLAALGEGGMATVYLAGVGSGPLARMCAVKLLRANLPDHDYRTRFLDEARLVVRLHHNNLVDVRAAGEFDDQLYIVMEAIEGRDLADVWDRCAEVGRAFPVPLAVHVCREVLRGLHYAHTFPGLGLVHRDVSPSNVLLDWAGAVRLADFGLATSSLKASMTLPGVVFGKVGYMSPEQARHETLDGRADVYAVAVILWELLTGRPLRAAEGVSTDVVSRFEAVAPSSKSRRVDADLDAIVIKGLARNRNDRWETAHAMMLALNQWLAEHAADMGQELVADFMRKLFGNAREVESGHRSDLLRELTGPRVSSSSSGLSSASLSGARPMRPASPALSVVPIAPDLDATATDSSTESRTVRAIPDAPGIDSKELIEPGIVIADRYRVLSRLGRGGMGYVYLGEHLTVGRSVAIKVLTFEWSRTAAVAQRFRAEARAASAAGHPNIVEVFDAGELADGRLYLVMEFLTGRNLFEEVQTVGPLPVARACHIMRDVGRAIRAAHEVGIIHRDLKPDNVMLVDRARDEGEVVKVLDFGISSSAQRPDNTERLTTIGQALGTPEYMAPEQAKGVESDERFDIYAIGVMFFELLTGDPPFHGTNVYEIVSRKTSELAPSVGTQRANLSPELIKLVDDCLALDPRGRPQTAQLFLARLEDVLRKLPRDGRPIDEVHDEPTPVVPSIAAITPAIRPEPPTPARTKREDPPRARAPMYVVLAVGAVVAVLLGIWGSNALRERAEEGPKKIAGTTTGGTEIEQSPPDDLPKTPSTSTGPTTDPTTTVVELGDETTETETGSETETGGETGITDDTSETGGGGQKVVPKQHESATCRQIREDADKAASLWQWPDVLKLTKNRSCWASKAARVRLEVQAYKESDRWNDCVKAGKGATGEVGGWVTICQSKL